MKISHTIFISFFFILMLFSIATFINYKQSELVRENAEEFALSSTVVRHSNRFQRNFLNMVSGLRGYLLTNEIFFIQTYDSAILENEQILEDLTAIVPPSSGQSQLLNEIRNLNNYWLNEFATPLLEAKKLTDVSDSGKIAFTNLYREKVVKGSEKDVQRNLQRKFSEFTNYEYGVRDSKKELLAQTVQSTTNITFYLTLISIVAGVCIALFIAYYISSRIVKMVHMANSIADGNYEVHMDVKGNNEFSQLSRALNHMAAILHTNITLLKRQRDELDQFAHIVSHDIKTPLRGIDNVVTWIEEDHSFHLPPKVVEYLDLIKGRIKRAENLLKGILMYAHIGKENREREVLDVKELLLEIFEDIPKKEGIRLIVKGDMPVVYTERIPLRQVFTNLISNAIKYHDKASGTVKVYHTMLNHDYIKFFVEDDGPGIDPAYHEKIFVIFQTLGERDSLESTGVGLAIVKKILDDRNLHIEVTSQVNNGSTFSFTWTNNEYDEKSN